VRARNQGGELFQELHGLEEQVAGAVGPGGLEGEPDAAVAGEPEAVLGHRGPEEVAAELFEPGPVRGRYPDAGPGAPAQGDPAQDGGAADSGEGEGFLRERIRRGHVLVARQPPAPEQPQDTAADRGQEPNDLVVAWRRGRVEAEAGRVLAEHAVEGEGVEVDVEVQPAAEALDDGEGARVAIDHAVLPRLTTVEVQEGPDEDAEDRTAEAVVPGEEVAQTVREAQHPLADGDVGQHAIHEAGSAFGHAPAAATGAEASPFAGERDQTLQGAGVAPEAREAVGEDAAGQELAEPR